MEVQKGGGAAAACSYILTPADQLRSSETPGIKSPLLPSGWSSEGRSPGLRLHLHQTAREGGATLKRGEADQKAEKTAGSSHTTNRVGSKKSKKLDFNSAERDPLSQRGKFPASNIQVLIKVCFNFDD